MAEDGVADFRIIDRFKWMKLLSEARCGLCGEPLGRHRAFIGGPQSHQNRCFTDLPMHKECAEYAMRVCPYLAVPNFHYAESIRAPEGAQVYISPAVSPTRPDKFFLATARSFEVVEGPGGTALIRASAWESTEWWQLGTKLST